MAGDTGVDTGGDPRDDPRGGWVVGSRSPVIIGGETPSARVVPLPGETRCTSTFVHTATPEVISNPNLLDTSISLVRLVLGAQDSEDRQRDRDGGGAGAPELCVSTRYQAN